MWMGYNRLIAGGNVHLSNPILFLGGVVIVGTLSAMAGTPTIVPATQPVESNIPADYKGKPFEDSKYKSGEQKIPGAVMCAYYDLGGEGVAYHDTTPNNLGSGGLNPLNGEYLNEFRHDEGVDTSYTKYGIGADNSPFNLVTPPDKLLYVGWTEPGEWFNLTVDVAQAGPYTVDILYTSNKGAEISFDLNGKPVGDHVQLATTNTPADPIAWRQWHHWNILPGIVRVRLPAGRSVLTVHILTEGNMNLAYFDFKVSR